MSKFVFANRGADYKCEVAEWCAKGIKPYGNPKWPFIHYSKLLTSAIVPGREGTDDGGAAAAARQDKAGAQEEVLIPGDGVADDLEADIVKQK